MKNIPPAKKVRTRNAKNPFVLFRYASITDIVCYIFGIATSLVSGLGYPLMSIIMGNITQAFMDITEGLDSNQFSIDVKRDCIKFAVLGAVIFACGFLQSVFLVKACDNVITNWRKRFFMSLLRQDIAWYDSTHSGSLAPKLFDNLERIREGSGDKIGLLFQFLAQFGGGFVVALSHDWKLTLIMMSLSPFIMISGSYVATIMASMAQDESKIYEKAGGIVDEVLSSITTVQSFNGQTYEIQRYEKSLEQGRKLGIRKALSTGVGIGFTFLFMFTSYALAFWIGINYAANGTIDGGTIIILGPQFAVVGAAVGAATSLVEIIERVPVIDSFSAKGKRPVSLKGHIKLCNVYFSYPSRPDVPILKGISLEAIPGQTIALVGPSGCGKSTITQLILRYYEQIHGEIKIDDYEISDLNIEYLRTCVGIVSQEPNLFNTTIEENIRYGCPAVSNSDIVKALKEANAYDFVMKFPRGLQTLVGNRGAQLSGGQKQRIAIARALVRNPKVLLLDEATSALDAESEYIVQKALENASKGRTTFVIAHRLSTIRNANSIIVMNSGEIVEQGTHTELMNLKGLYHNLVSNQVLADVKQENICEDNENEKQRDNDIESLTSNIQPLHSNKKHSQYNQGQVSKLRTENLLSIIRKSRPEWLYLIVAFLSASTQGCVFPAFAWIFVQIIQTFTEPPEQMKCDGHFWAVMFLTLGGLMFVTMIIQTFFFGLAAESMSKRFRIMVFENILRMDKSYFDKPENSPGKLSTHLATDAPCLKSAIDFRLGTAFGALIGLVVGIGIAFYYGWQMALLAVLMSPLTIIGQSIQMQYTLGAMGGKTSDMVESGKIAVEAIENIRTVHSLTLERKLYDDFTTLLSRAKKNILRQAVSQGLAYGFAVSVFFFLFASCFRFGLWLIENNYMYPFPVLNVLFAISFTTGGLGIFSGYFPEYMKAVIAAGKIFSMLEEETVIDGLSEEGGKMNKFGDIVISNLRFSYPQRPTVPILKGIDLKLKKGQTVAFVGPSGCGKSTIITLLERNYKVDDGSIEIDGVNVEKINTKHIRNHIALVSQEPVLFDRSISENITYGVSEYVKHELIEEACREANIHEFITSLPQGYDTRVGEKGVLLSGGQKQRIAIARALVRNPSVLLLDEATSALDSESEKIVQEALDKAATGRTCIVIAHRLSTIQNADYIIVFSNGNIIERGTHDELLQKRGMYYDLALKQSGN